MRYGFVIDQERCIGCHACTVACKEEHNVPVGVFRTWVKYIEKGTFPAVQRHFGVMRCNHCDNAPCIEICPTKALFRRDNGVVDFDSQRCIGCKSCMQACPYDALYIDPASHTAAKCNFCAHRLELDLAPACVIVCPTHAIIAGDLDAPESEIGRTVASRQVVSRKPEKATQPKLFYIGIDGDLLNPGAPAAQPTYLWADKQKDGNIYTLSTDEATLPPAGSREVYNVSHPAPWGAKIAAYLWTKSIAAGVTLVAALLMGLKVADQARLFGIATPALALGWSALTGLLLTIDLKRPERFYFLLTKSNFRSWLVLGAYFLGGYGLCAMAWLIVGLFALEPPAWLIGLTALMAIGTAAYSGFLFAQAKGRDLWQSPLFPWHLVIQALVAGAAMLIMFAVAVGSDRLLGALQAVLATALVLDLLMVLTEVYAVPHNQDARLAVDLLKSGTLAKRFWGGAAGLGVVVPLFAMAMGASFGGAVVAAPLAAAAALAGLWQYELLWLAAGQAAPLS
ncbi:MAG TPA: NrfD/PsrC family molybdoenzyme membrane anchor subunit [Candidatus Binataceae bacterium]|nr:NrfD/PsrC family molybdoenzyme membrane anchor subunit [Candidatus Binataceae bacterium]